MDTGERAGAAEEERRILAVLTRARQIQGEIENAAPHQDRFREVMGLLDDVQVLCLRYLRTYGLTAEHRWAADLLLRAVHERNCMERARRLY